MSQRMFLELSAEKQNIYDQQKGKDVKKSPHVRAESEEVSEETPIKHKKHVNEDKTAEQYVKSEESNEEAVVNRK